MSKRKRGRSSAAQKPATPNAAASSVAAASPLPAWLQDQRLQHGAAIGLLVLVVLVTWVRQIPPGVLDMTSDMHAIAAIAASKEHPERYAADPLLNDPSRFDRYTPVYVWALTRAYRLIGGFPEAAHAFVLPTGLLFVTGTYLLLWRVMGLKVVAVAFTLALALSQIWFQLGEKWSVLETWGTMPRTQYTAIFPWLMLAAWEARYRVRWWPAVCALLGASIYVHPVSAPPIGLALWGALLLSTGDRLKWRPRLQWAAISAVAALAVAAPSVQRQLTPRLRGLLSDGKPQVARHDPNLPPEVRAERQEFLTQLAHERFSPGLMDLRRGYELIWDDLRGAHPEVSGGRYNHLPMFLWSMAWMIAGIVVGVRKPETRAALGTLAIATALFSLPTVWLPLYDSIRSSAAGHKPHFYDLARGFRWWPLGFMAIGAVGMGALRLGPPSHRRTTALWVVTLLATPSVLLAYGQPIRAGAGRFLFGYDRERIERNALTREAVAFIADQTPPDAAFAVPKALQCYWLRHTPGRPVVHSWKEGSSFSHDYELAKAWHDRNQQQARLQALDQQIRMAQHALRDPQVPLERKQQLAAELPSFARRAWALKQQTWRSWGADYALQLQGARPPDAAVLFENAMWYVAKVNAPAPR